MTAIEEFEAASHRLVRECTDGESISMATSVFLGIVLSFMRHHGEDADKAITLEDPNGARKITIHAKDTQ